MNKIIKNTLLLTALTVILGLILGYVHQITEEPIAQQEAATKQAAFSEVFPEATNFQELELTEDEMDVRFADAIAAGGYTDEYIDGVAAAMDDADQILGYVFTITTKEGYGGDIQFVMGISNENVIKGISFLSIEETAGLGMKATGDDFKSQFVDKPAELLEYSKTGAEAENQIDALSGATITTNAVTNGVNAGVLAFQSIAEGGES